MCLWNGFDQRHAGLCNRAREAERVAPRPETQRMACMVQATHVGVDTRWSSGEWSSGEGSRERQGRTGSRSRLLVAPPEHIKVHYLFQFMGQVVLGNAVGFGGMRMA